MRLRRKPPVPDRVDELRVAALAELEKGMQEADAAEEALRAGAGASDPRVQTFLRSTRRINNALDEYMAALIGDDAALQEVVRSARQFDNAAAGTEAAIDRTCECGHRCSMHAWDERGTGCLALRCRCVRFTAEA